MHALTPQNGAPPLGMVVKPTTIPVTVAAANVIVHPIGLRDADGDGAGGEVPGLSVAVSRVAVAPSGKVKVFSVALTTNAPLEA